MKRHILGITTILLAGALPALAQPTIDGTIVGDNYGPAVSVQAVETQFGDNESELDAAYCTSDGTRLYLALTGNLQNNFNKLEIFIDSKTGGENVLSGSPGNDGSGNMAGMGFDPGFTADYHIIVRRGFFGGDRFDLDFAELGTGNFSSYGDLFLGSLDGAGATGTGVNLSPILVGFNNSNTAGVLGGTGAADQAAALAVRTGLELGITFADLGHVTQAIRVCAFVNNGDHNYASNQFLGPIQPPHGNLGGDGTGIFTGNIGFNLANFPGDQYFVCMDRVIPVEQTTWSRIKAIGR